MKQVNSTIDNNSQVAKEEAATLGLAGKEARHLTCDF
jgi:hypothetical protein